MPPNLETVEDLVRGDTVASRGVARWRWSLLAVRRTELAQADAIPAFKIRVQWHVKRTEIDPWIDAQPRGGDGGGRGE